MANASRDGNFVPTLTGVSNVDGTTPVNVYVDPTTHRLLTDTAAGTGTVTSVSVVSANGFAGTVATATTTPAITLTTTITGILSGNGTAISAASTTGSGAVVLASGPTLSAPLLGTPASGNLVNCTGYTVANVGGLGTGVATALAVNVGTAGAFVVLNGALGTPSSGTLTSATGLPISTGLTGAGTGVLTALAVNVGSAGAFVTFNGAGGTPSSMTATNLSGTAASLTAGAVAVGGVTGLGSGVATWLATPSSANLATAVTGKTGSGALVFGTSPTLDTAPVLAAATNLKYTVPTSDVTATGVITNEFNSGYSSTAIGDLVYLDSSATWQKADADLSAAAYSSMLGIALSVTASGAAATVLLQGFIYAATPFPTLTIGAPVYMSATAGAVTNTAPVTTDSATRIVGYGVHADKMWFCPSNDWITHT